MPRKRVDEKRVETTLKEPLEQTASKIEARIAVGRDILDKAPNPGTSGFDWETMNRVERDLRLWHDYNVTLMRALFTGDEIVQEYDWSAPFSVVRDSNPVEDYSDSIDRASRRIERLESINSRLGLYKAPEPKPAAQAPIQRPTRSASNRVFVVHGHADAARETVARFLEHLDLEAVILHEQANAGQTLMQKLQRNADVAFAVVLFTPDDVGASKRDFDASKDKLTALKDRVRQNVMLELGYFAGHLGLHNVAVLHVGSIEIPTDLLGVAYIEMDPHGGWKLQLARELKQCGLQVDMNKA